MVPPVTDSPAAARPGRISDQELVATLFDLGRQVTSVLDLDELLHRLPELVARLISFQALAVYLLERRRNELRVAYAVGYPPETESYRMKVGTGLVGAAVAEKRPILVDDVAQDPRYVALVPGMRSELVVPLVRKGQVIGAINLLSECCNQFTEADVAVMRQFGAHVAVALENAQLFDQQVQYADTLETLAEIGREVAAILDLDELLTRIAHLTKRVIDYRTFGILLLNEQTQELEMKVALHYGENAQVPRVKMGVGLVGYAALHKEPVLVADVSADPRYLKVVEDVRSELVIPMLIKDRCIGVFDLESPEPDAFTKAHVEILTLLAAQAAVAIENARLYEAVAANEERLEKEVRFAQRVQMALLPQELPRRRGVDLAARFAAARELGGDFYEVLSPEAGSLVVAVGDVSGKGVPAALYSAFAGELVRGRTFRRRFAPERSHPAGVLTSINTILNQRNLEEYYCTLCYALFDFKRRTVTFANSGLPYPVRCTEALCERVELPGVPLGSFADTTYDEISYPLANGDVFVFCTDGVSEAMDAESREFSSDRLVDVVRQHRDRPARQIVDAVLNAVADFRGEAPVTDDMTALALRIVNI
jgi:sigma-B regulation protein RsbU (phosphoserine phosphatase)